MRVDFRIRLDMQYAAGRVLRSRGLLCELWQLHELAAIARAEGWLAQEAALFDALTHAAAHPILRN